MNNIIEHSEELNLEQVKYLKEFYVKNREFRYIIEYAIENILTDMVINENIDLNMIYLLYEITENRMFMEMYSILKTFNESKKCPVCGGRLKFSGCPIVVCKKCKREFIIHDNNIIKLCDYCVSRKQCDIKNKIKEENGGK